MNQPRDRKHAASTTKYLTTAVACLALAGCSESPVKTASAAKAATDEASPAKAATKPPVTPKGIVPSLHPDESMAKFLAFGRRRVEQEINAANNLPPKDPSTDSSHKFRAYGRTQGEDVAEEFFKGRFNRSRARLPENIEKWRSEPDIGNPGPDLANFPNSAFTLPKGRAYIEISPFTYYGTGQGSPAQYNAEFLLRYGATDDIELRLFGNGVSWIGGSNATWGFSPIAFDAKIQLWTEKQEYFLPAAGFETYLQTEWLGNQAFNVGTQPSFAFNFDQSLPFEIDLEYNLGATRFQDNYGQNVWEFSFQWALQRDLFNKDFAVFVHGFYNAASLPRLPNALIPFRENNSPTQNAVGGGFIWTVNRRLAVYGQTSGGTTSATPSIISLLGFAVSF